MAHRNKNKKNNSNLFHLPDLPKRIMEKAVQALKDNQYEEAKRLFAQLLEIDEEHSQAAYGMAICLLELAEYEPAEKLTREMLQKDMGDYFEVFRLHITVLIQTNQYDKGAEMLQSILEEIEMPPETRESYIQLLDFCQARQKDQQDFPKIPDSSPDSTSVSPEEVKVMMDSLGSDLPPEKKWSAIHALYDLEGEQTFEIVQPLLIKDSIDPFTKTLMLKALGENGYSGDAEVRKFNTSYTIKIHPDQKLLNPITREIKESIHNILLSENPTLCDQVVDVWEHFSYASYPMDLTIGSTQRWAAACTAYVYQLNGMTDDLNRIYELFEVDQTECDAQYEEIKKVEEDPSTLDFI